MGFYASTAALIALALADGPAPQQMPYLIVGQAKFQPEEAVGFCGVTTRADTILRYFDQIRRDISIKDLKRFEKYYANRVTVGYRGRTYELPKSRIVRSKSLRLNLDDWRAIAHLSRTQLGSGGWRGCFLGGGKVFFAIQDDGQLRLVSFDKDRRWK